MDQPVKRALWLAGLAAFGLASAASGADLPDPTRPPASALAAAGEPAAAEPVLQSVLLSPKRRAAIISGQTVPLGGTFQGARLVAITETEVVLRNGREVQRLKLYPDLQKQAVRGAAAARPGVKP